MKNNIIPKDAKVHFKTIGDSSILATAEVYEDTEVHENAIMMIDNAPYCTKNFEPVTKISDNEYKVDLWIQDVMLIHEGFFYNSTSDID